MKAILISITVLACITAWLYHGINNLVKPLPKPEFDTNVYWGPGSGLDYKAPEDIVPFKIKYDQTIIDDLRAQLNRTWKYAAPLDGIKFQYGFNTDALKHIVIYWREFYLPKWSQRQAYLNSLPHFKTEIQGLKIHYIHAKPSEEARKQKKVVPLLLLHGWPASVRELYDFINLLVAVSDIHDHVYEVIAPSLVGYGWSDPATKPGFNAAQMAIVMRNLMLRIGFDKFLVQGGDWGSITGSAISTLFPENVLGFHSNMCTMYTPLALAKLFIASWAPERYLPSRFFYEHHFPLKAKFSSLFYEMGYFHLQATKPDTIGTALQTNPIGLAAYFLEKFQTVTGPGLNQQFNAMDKVYKLDPLLDNIMIYYLTDTATTSVRFYAENLSKEFLGLQLDRVQSPVPMGCARFKHDLTAALDWALKDKFPNLVHSTYYNQGGHFAAFELPGMLYINFQEFVKKVNLE
ncbi:PREDICTED: juvenile hormone epoxide hydrolase 1 [Rhagoletis zephyria]|uniref:juvenile hormone epoxide hydrolase 1 n=1 Tax=Rhagoletis zephyria TaxID=28612 RepID=UPI00081142A1|nr:PREDICTED: juvenile hormone epoxide hydrolase 1 [Rhagoletis zephyria]